MDSYFLINANLHPCQLDENVFATFLNFFKRIWYSMTTARKMPIAEIKQGLVNKANELKTFVQESLQEVTNTIGGQWEIDLKKFFDSLGVDPDEPECLRKATQKFIDKILAAAQQVQQLPRKQQLEIVGSYFQQATNHQIVQALTTEFPELHGLNLQQLRPVLYWLFTLLAEYMSPANESLDEAEMSDDDVAELKKHREAQAKREAKKQEKTEEQKKIAARRAFQDDVEKVREQYEEKWLDLFFDISRERKFLARKAKEEAQRTEKSYRALRTQLLDSFYDKWIPKVRELNQGAKSLLLNYYKKHNALTPEEEKRINYHYPTGNDDSMEEHIDDNVREYIAYEARRD